MNEWCLCVWNWWMDGWTDGRSVGGSGDSWLGAGGHAGGRTDGWMDGKWMDLLK